MRVSEIMTPAPITIDAEAPVGTAIAVMAEREVRHLPVVNESGKVIGMLSDRDVRFVAFAPAFAAYLTANGRRRLQSVGDALENLLVRHVMTWGVMTIGAAARVEQAAAMMFEERVSALPVLEHGELVGIVTGRDVLRELALALPSIKGDADTVLW